MIGGQGERAAATQQKHLPLILLFVTEIVSLQLEAATLPDSAALHYISNDAMQFELRIQYKCQKQMFICRKAERGWKKKQTQRQPWTKALFQVFVCSLLGTCVIHFYCWRCRGNALVSWVHVWFFSTTSELRSFQHDRSFSLKQMGRIASYLPNLCHKQRCQMMHLNYLCRCVCCHALIKRQVEMLFLTCNVTLFQMLYVIKGEQHRHNYIGCFYIKAKMCAGWNDGRWLIVYSERLSIL